jgi:ketosteroid isomerase-like protein
MAERSEIANLLPRLAELRRNAAKARRLALQANTPSEIDNLSIYANDLDREADAVEVRLAILRAAVAVSNSGHEVAALIAP